MDWKLVSSQFNWFSTKPNPLRPEATFPVSAHTGDPTASWHQPKSPIWNWQHLVLRCGEDCHAVHQETNLFSFCNRWALCLITWKLIKATSFRPIHTGFSPCKRKKCVSKLVHFSRCQIGGGSLQFPSTGVESMWGLFSSHGVETKNTIKDW